MTPTLIKDCIAVLKGAGIVPADVQVTNDIVQRLVWLASVAAATIVPTYRNSLPVLLLPLLHAGMPNASILSCFERMVGTLKSCLYTHKFTCAAAGVDKTRPILQHQRQHSCQDRVLRSSAPSVRATFSHNHAASNIVCSYHDPLSIIHLYRCRIEVDLIIEGWLAAMCGWDSSCDACALLWDYALADDSCFNLIAFCVVALMSMRHVITSASPSDVQAAVNAFALKDVATTMQVHFAPLL